MSFRQNRVASVIKEQISLLLQRNYTTQEIGFITITDVEVARDLKFAKIFVSVLGEKDKKEKSIQILNSEKPLIREELANLINLRFAPDISFHIDDSLDRAMNIESLLKKIHDEKENRSAK